MTRSVDVDVAVVGAGPAGSSLAARLARLGLAVALLDRSRFDEQRIGETLQPSVPGLLRELGCWDAFLALDPVPSAGTWSVWGDAVPRQRPAAAAAVGDSGWHVDRRAFDAMLVEHAAACGASVRLGCSAGTCAARGARWTIALSTGPAVVARALVDATGRAARVARSLGARRRPVDRLVAVATTFRTPEPVTPELVVETSPDGWWYSAPLPSGETAVALMTDADLCRRHGLATPTTWSDRLRVTTLTAARLTGGRPAATTPTAGRLAPPPGPTRPRVHPATSQRLRPSAPSGAAGDRPPGAGPVWLAVGDAALAVDPVTGAGVVHALRGAADAAAALEQVLAGAAGSPVADLERRRDAQAARYLAERARHYGRERRWETPFWQRRRAVPVPSPEALDPAPVAVLR